jgi:hypothetical protein
MGLNGMNMSVGMAGVMGTLLAYPILDFGFWSRGARSLVDGLEKPLPGSQYKLAVHRT